MRFLYTLKFQIGLALLCLILALTGSILASQYMFEELYNTEKIIQLGGKLQKSSQQMSMQAMNYIANTPADSSTYNRDLNLYYKDLMSHIDTFDMIDEAFMSKQFSQEMTGMDDMVEPSLSADVEQAVRELHKTWLNWREKLMSQLGTSASMPHLALAAEYVENNGEVLMQATNSLIDNLDLHASSRKRQLERFNQFLLFFSIVTVVGIIFWFYKRVILPLDKTSQGMKKIALGNFEQRLPVDGNDEITQMNVQFNHLSHHLHSLFQLMTRLSEGGNLDEILSFISEEFSRLIPLDWIGILFVTGDNKIQLERGYSEQTAENFGSIRFDLEGTLLQESLLSNQLLHIPDIQARLEENDSYKFLNILVEKNCKEAIFMPLDETEVLQGVLVFASKQSHLYRPEHLALLKNLSLLITLSFSRTVKLADYQHLAAIGSFATGIAHEIRSPLATINMALDYFKTNEMSEGIKKRALLASEEAERLKRLMEEILLYAKPLQIKTSPGDFYQIVLEVAELYREILTEKNLHFEILTGQKLPAVTMDKDRIKQVLINLLQNAIEASDQNDTIVGIASVDPVSGWINFQLNNKGKKIALENLQKVFEPFFTTRAHGTGLGLNIAKRIIEAHGGELHVMSNSDDGTTFELALPPAH